MSVFPNPANEHFTVKADYALNRVVVSDISGKQLLLKESSAKELNIDVKDLAKGIYILSVETQEGVSISRIIKE